ncbi:NAD(P)-binding protein [Serendipita vermifera]|nr:NAD(P)-binding protein [Serendipita vermifera]
MSFNELASSRPFFTKDFHRDVYPFIDPSKPELALKDKVVLVTGGGRGIGASIVEAFAKAHAKTIIMTGRSESTLANTKNKLEKAHPETKFITISVDISSEDSVNGLYESLKEKFDYIDILVNNAGVLNEFGPKVGDTSVDKFWADMTVNTKGPYLLSRGLIKFNPDNYGATFIALTSGINEEFTNNAAYQLSKIPPIKLVQILNAEYRNIRAYAVNPGVVPTDSLLESFKPFAHDKPTLVAAVCVWLCSPQADFLSGRFLDARWDMEQVVARKEEITKGDWLKLAIGGY